MADNIKNLTIRTLGDPVLNKIAKPVQEINEDLKVLAERMIQTMYHANGIGLAAPQVGIGIRMFVIHVYPPEDQDGKPLPVTSPGEAELLPQMPLAFINPEVTPEGEELSEYDEGCLSVSGIYAPVVRPARIRVKAQLLDGRTIQCVCGGLLARCIQHENDHLDGVVFVQRLSDGAMKEARGEIEAFLKKTGRKGFRIRKAENKA